MKSILLSFAVAGLLPVASGQPNAQQVPRPRMIPPQSSQEESREGLGANYRIHLRITGPEKEEVELAVVTESTVFMTDAGDELVNLRGTIRPDGSGGFTVAFQVGWRSKITTDGSGKNHEYRDSATTGSVILKSGQTIQIFKAGKRTGELTLSTVEADAK